MCALVVALAASLLVVPPVPVLSGAGLGVSEAGAQSAGTAGVTSHSRAFLHRTVIEEGQTRQFEISNLPDRPAYYVFFKPLAGYTAEASDVTFKVHWRRDGLVEVAAGEGRRASVNALRERLRFEVAAHSDGDSDDETFGVQLCTTADCEGGTVLGDWTVTITDVSDTTLTGTGASITVSGGSTTMMERLTNNDNRDVSDTITVTIPYASRPTQSIVVVGLVDTTTMAKWGTEAPIANIRGGLARHAEAGPTTPRHAFTINLDGVNIPDGTGLDVNENGTVEEDEWVSEFEVSIAAFNNAVDTPGGVLSGNLVFTVYQYDEDYYDTTNCRVDLGLGPQTVKCPDTRTAPTVYTGIVLPDVPLTVTDDDEVTEIELHHAATTDQVATEGSTSDTAKFRVTLGRGLAAGETLTVPLAFQGATLGTHFRLSLDGSPQGVVYADSADGATGELTFTGPSAAEATVVVTAATDDGDTATNNLVVRTYPTSEPWKGNHITTNLAGGVCSGDGCGPVRLAERLYRITLNEAQAGLAVIDNGGGRLLEGNIVENVPVVVPTQSSQVRYRIDEQVVTEGGDYSYEVRLSAAPTSNVTVAASSSDTTKATITTGGSLTFTPSNWTMPQTVTVSAVDNQADAADIGLTITHAVTGAGSYASIPNVAHALVLVDDDPTEVSMVGTGVRTSPSGTQISEVMVEGDATRVDRSLTISLSRALTANEWVRVPLYLEATGHRHNPDVECDLNLQDWSDISLERWADYVACDVVSSVRGPRYSANVAWPVHHNDFEMAAVGTGVSVEAVNRYTPAHVGFRWLEFAGAGAQEATIVLKARGGFDDGDVHDEAFHISFPRGLQSVRNYTDDGHVFSPQRHLNPQTNLGGGVTAAHADAQAWYGIADDEEGGSSAPEMPAGWPLLPSGLNPGDSFRLIYATSQTTTAQSRDLAVYDAFVRAEITGNALVNGGVAALADHAGHFKAIAETSVEGSSAFSVTELTRTTARDHAQFNPDNGDHPDVRIYWVGGTKVADDNADFTDGDWDDEANPRRADGTAATVHVSGYWTGSGRDGAGIEVCSEISNGITSTRYPRLGWTDATVGLLNNSSVDGFPLGPRTDIASSCGRQHGYSHNRTEMRPMYALSGEFTVVAAGATIESATAAEGSAATFTVTIPDAAPLGGITVPYTFDHGLGISTDPAHIVADNNDFADTDGEVTIAQGDTTAAITVATTDDSTYEGDHYFRVTLGTPTGTDAPGVHPTKGTATGTITDKADLPNVAFSSATASAAEDAGTIDVTVTKTGTTAVPLSIYWTTADDTAAHPTDYTAQSGYLEFATGDTTKTLTIPIVDDNTAENTETFKVQLDGTLAVDARVGSTGETTITLTDDDVGGAAGVTLSGSALTLTELHATDAEMSYTVVLDSDPGAVVVVTVSSGDPTAVAVDTDSDMAGDQSMLTFTHGNTGNWNSAQTVTLRAVNDGDAAAETVTVSHAAEVSDAGNPYHQIPINSVTATTVDAGHKIVVVPAAVSVNEGDTAEYGIRLASNPGGAVALHVTAVNSSGSLTVSPVTVSFNAGNWMSAQTVTISGGSGGAGGVTHSVSSSAGAARSRYPVNMVGPQVDVTVVSSAALVFDVGEGVAVSEESGHTDTYEVKLNKAPSADVTVAITAAAGAAVNPASLTFTTTNWDTGQEVTVSGVDDNTINTGGARMVTISHSTSSSDNDFNALSGNVTVRVADTDTTPTLGITPAQVQSSAFASGGTVTLTLTPEHVTFFGVGDGDGLGPESGDRGDGILRSGGSLSASGLALLTFTGEPTGLTVDSAELGAAMSDVHGQPKHRSLEVVLSYSGSAITADDPVTLNVGRRLLRRSLSATKAVPYGASLSADFTIKAPEPVTVSMAGSDGDANGNAVEGASGATGYRTITLTLGRALTGSEEVTVPLSVVGATVTDDYTFGLEPATQDGVSLTTTGGTHTAQDPAVVFSAGASSATLRLKPVDNSVRSQPYVVVGYGTGARAPAGSGVTLDTPTGGPVGVVLVDDETGDFEVAADWPLLPSGLSGGDEFRLMFITSQTRTAESTDIDVYNEWAQGVVAAGGHAGLKPYAGLVRVVGSTTTVDARVNAGMHTGSAWADGSANASSSGVKVYWLAEPSSDKVADNYFDFFDGSWDGGADQSGADTVESGAARTVTAGFWTGSNEHDGRKASIATRRLGATTPSVARVSLGNPLSDTSAMSDASLPMLAMSPVFKVEAAATPELTFASAAYSEAEDGGSVDVTVNASSAPSAALTVNLDSQAETATEASDYTAPPTTFTFPAAMTSHTFSVNITDDNTVEGDETFTMTLASGTGYTVGTPATTTVTITDDDTPPVTVTMSASDGDSDGNAVEGGAGTTGHRTITLTLGRELAGSEQVTVPLTVVGATVTTDYTFGLQPTTQTGVSLNTSGSNSAQNPAVVFASGARTATLRLTPVDNNVRTQPYAIVDYGSGSRAPAASGGVTLDTPTGGPIGVVLVDDETGDIVLPAGAGFRPGVSNNAEYRLLFMTSAGGAATSTDIADYDHFVRAAAVANGGADLLPYAGFFRAFVSTASTHGREHVGIWGSGAFTDGTTQGSDSGTELYWLGTGGEQVSSSYWLFCNRPWTGRWSATATRLRHEDGSVGNGAKVWTGMNNNCTTSSNQLGTSTPTYGPGAQAGSGGSPTQSNALSLGTEAAASENRFYAVSDVFKTVASADMPQVVFDSRTGSANEGETVRLTLRASPAPTADLTLTYIVEESGGDATAGQDFTAGEASVTIPAGQTSVAFDVATLEDGVFERSESFRVRLAASPDYLRGSARVSTVTILEVERLQVGFAQAEYWALEDGGSVDVELALSHGTERAVSLTLSVGGTATGGSDYTAPAASVTIPPGNTSRTHTITIPIAADTTVEPDETITLAIASVTTTNAGTANRSRTTVFIADQDHASAGLVAPSTVEVDEGGTATYRLRLATAPSGTVTVTVSGQTSSELTLDADDSTNGDQATVQFTPSNWYVGRKVTVRGVHDEDLTDDSVTLAHSASGADYGSVTGSVAATVDDEDVTLSITGGAAVTEGTAAEFTVTASPAPDRDLTVNVGIADAAGADFVAAGQQGNRTRILPAGQATAMFTVPTVADFNEEPSGPITITLQNSDNYMIDSSAASAMVQVDDDDDAAVTVAMSASRDNAVEGATDATGYSDITLTLGGPLSGTETLTVPLTVTGATVTTDYTFALVPTTQTGVALDTSGPHSAQNPAVVFTAGATTATLRLTPVDNDVRTQPYVIVDFGPGATASGGINVGEQTGGPINVVLVDDETGDIEVAADWALAPSGLSAGDEFRLIFITSQTRTAASTDIDDYNDWAQLVVAEHGHAALLPYSGLVSVIASTATVDARENTAMWDPALNSNAGGYTDSSTSDSDSGTKIYWLAAPSAHKVADNYFDFYDASWDTGTNNRSHSTNEAATPLEAVYWTGSSDAGEAVSGNALGEANPQYGHVETFGSTPLDHTANADNATRFGLLTMSPVFKIDPSATGPEVSVRLMTGEGENRNDDGEVEKPENDATVSFPLTLDAQPAAALMVCVRVAESGDTDRVAAADEGIKTVSFNAGVQTGSIDVAWTDNDDDDLDSVITVTAVPSSTAGCSSTDSYTVSGTNGSDKARITDDEATEVTLTASDTAMSEQDASDTATLTVSLGRPLIAGESLVARITLATSTDARLPGHATPDFAVTASGTGVALANAATTTSQVTFTGSDSNTVQTATVTLTPIATAAGDDGDTSDEEITANLLRLITGTGSGTVVTGGGAAVVEASSEVDLTIDDDDASACSAQSSVFSGTSLRILETGETTYCVRLANAPSAGDTTVMIGRTGAHAGAASVSPSSLTFTALNYTEPQEVTVTGVDDPGTHQERSLTLTHTANGGGYSSQSLGSVRVEVSDAPEVEVFAHVRYDDEDAWRWFVNANGGMLRPSTVTAAPGVTPMRNVTPCCEVQYAVRLSNRPLGGAVTVDISVGDFGGTTASAITGISLTRDGTPEQSLRIRFEDRAPDPGCGWLVQTPNTHYDSNYREKPGVSDSYDNNADTSWECYRFIWVHNKREHQSPTRSLCADITHTATGGGVRKVTVDTIRMHSLGFNTGRVHDNPACPFLYANTLGTPQNSPLPAQAPPVPTTAVAGLSVAGGGGTTATASWDAVPHATKYSVSYSAQAADGSLTQTVGAFDDITATSLTFDHGVTAPATVTVTVTPGYDNDDSDGGTPTVTYLDGLAATVTLNIGTTPDAGETAQEEEGTGGDGPVAPPPGCVSDDTLELARDYYDVNKHRAPGYGKTWRRVLIAFGDVADAQLEPFTAAEASQSETRWAGWGPFREALECIEKAQQDPAPPPVEPEIAVTAGAGVTEGGDAVFTITAAPAPHTALSVDVTLTQTGDFVSTGTQTVTIGTTGSYTLTVATTDDSADEADGSVTAAIGTGTGYTVSTSSGAATVAVADNDIPEITITAGTDVTEGGDAVFTIAADPLPHTALDVAVEITQTGDHGAAAGTRTVTIPATGTYTLTVATTNDSDDEADGSITATVSTGAGYTVSSANSTATVAVADDDDPPPPPPPPVECVSDETLRLARDYYELNRHRAPGYGSNWRRVLVAFGDVADDQLTAFTAAEALAREQIWYGWKPFREALECIEAAQ
ncbi:Calx-beta domain-containing protein [Candidatus Poriferisodalis sp.]|uniref:Calx-beta domain-containing protein n=1 Tax=Candidatus Poriferisodalis sp. TaxID=3101277 RepID=UPI003B51E78F